MKEIFIPKNGHGGDYRTCDYYNCEKPPKHKIRTFVGDHPRTILACDEHAPFFHECEKTFAPLRKLLTEKYGRDYDHEFYGPFKLSESDYGRTRDGGRVWQG